MPTIMITGANRGIGLALARQYAGEGWRVIATSRDPAKADVLRALGPNIAVYTLDVSDFAAVAALGRKLEAETIDVFLANAGVLLGQDMVPQKIELEAWIRSFIVNAMAPLACAGAFLKQVARSPQRKMLAMSSRAASMAANCEGGGYVYRSSKAALNSVWRSLAIDHPEVIAAVLSPGRVRTDMTKHDGPLSPDESATALRRVIAGLTQKDTGGFFRYDGNPVDW